MATRKINYNTLRHHGWPLSVAAFTICLCSLYANADPFVSSRWISNSAKYMRAGDRFHNMTVIGERELDDLRGGFSIGGLEIDFGVAVRTLVDGALAFETRASFTGTDLVSDPQHLTSGQRAANVNVISTESQFGAPDASPRSTPIRSGNVSGQSINEIVPQRMDLSGLTSASGVVINDDKGFTAILHDITRSRILSAVITASDGRDIRHEMNIKVIVSNFNEFHQNALSASLKNRFSNALGR